MGIYITSPKHAKQQKQNKKTPLKSHLRSVCQGQLKVVETSTNQKSVCNFRLVFHCNHMSIFYRFQHAMVSWSKICIFSPSLLCDATHSANYAVTKCPSVRLSVTYQYYVKTTKHIIALFHHQRRVQQPTGRISQAGH